MVMRHGMDFPASWTLTSTVEAFWAFCTGCLSIWISPTRMSSVTLLAGSMTRKFTPFFKVSRGSTDKHDHVVLILPQTCKLLAVDQQLPVLFDVLMTRATFPFLRVGLTVELQIQCGSFRVFEEMTPFRIRTIAKVMQTRCKHLCRRRRSKETQEARKKGRMAPGGAMKQTKVTH